MNYIDIIIAVILLVSAIDGYRKGLIHQLAALASLILGIYLAIKFSSWIAPVLQQQLSFSANLSYIASFLLIFVLVAIAMYFLGKNIEGFFNEIELGPVNKITGLVFSVAKSLIVLSIIIFVFKMIPYTSNWPSEKNRQGSFFFEKIELIAPSIFPYFNKEI